MSEPANGAPRKPGQEALRPLPKRFYKAVTVAPVIPSPLVGEGQGGGDGRTSAVGGGEPVAFRLLLDSKPVRTPAKKELILPTRALAEAVAAEWSAQGERIDPAVMPQTRLVNSAIDGVAGRMGEVRADIARYAGSDLVCYRAESPPGLVDRQVRSWDPVLAWAQDDLGARFHVARGIMPAAQPADAVAAVARALDAHGAFDLAALHVMTTLMGSVLIALQHARGRLTLDAAWTAAHVDEDWQISQWGEDAEAKARRQQRWTEMQAASRLLALLSPSPR